MFKAVTISTGFYQKASGMTPRVPLASRETIAAIVQEEREERKRSKELRTRVSALRNLLERQSSSLISRFMHRKEIGIMQAELEAARSDYTESRVKADALLLRLNRERQKRKDELKALEREQKVKSMMRSMELRDHLQSSFFPEASKERHAAKQAELLNSLAELATKRWVSTEILRYQSGRNLPAELISPSHFMLVHLTSFLPLDGVIKPSSAYREDHFLRESIHFSLNSAVGSHMYGQWRGKEIAILMPLEGSMHWLNNFYTVDSYGYGKLKLPMNTVVLLDRRRAEAERVRDGSMMGRARVKVVDLHAINRTLRAAGIVSKEKQLALIERIHRMRGIGMESPQWWDVYNRVHNMASKRLKERDLVESYAFESPMHFAVVRELLNQGKLPMLAGMWSWCGGDEWWGNAGLSSFAKRYGFMEGPHNGHLGKKLEEMSYIREEEKTGERVGETAKKMRQELKRCSQENAIGGINPERTMRYLERQIGEWENRLLLRIM